MRSTDLLALEKYFPNFLFKPKANPKDNNFKNNLRDGLNALDKWFNKAKRSYHRLQKK
jgi:hypothetical protein